MNLLDLASVALAEFERTATVPTPAPVALQPPFGTEAANDEAARRWQVAARDDRRTCRQCANLAAGGRCLAAGRGELSHFASRKYSPVPDLPCRCAGYLPRADDPDRRPGRERWPELIADGERLRALPA